MAWLQAPRAGGWRNRTHRRGPSAGGRGRQKKQRHGQQRRARLMNASMNSRNRVGYSTGDGSRRRESRLTSDYGPVLTHVVGVQRPQLRAGISNALFSPAEAASRAAVTWASFNSHSRWAAKAAACRAPTAFTLSCTFPAAARTERSFSRIRRSCSRAAFCAQSKFACA